MSLTKIVATFACAITLIVAFSSSNELQAQSSTRSGIASGVTGLPSVVTDFGAAQGAYAAPSAAPMVSAPAYSPAPVYSPAPAYAPPVSSGSGCGCSAAPAAAPMPQPAASPCAGGCGGGCSGGCGGGCGGPRACGNKDFGTLRRAPATGLRGGLFQRGRPCNGCN